MKRRLAGFRGSDLILNEFGRMRFSLGVETEDGTPVIGINAHDTKAVMSVNWENAAIMLGHQGKDWIALAAKDIRDVSSAATAPMPLRLWLPFAVGVFDGWLDYEPSEVVLKRVQLGKRNGPVFEKKALKKLPLNMRDKWSFDA